jgi:hypothetical protein
MRRAVSLGLIGCGRVAHPGHLHDLNPCPAGAAQ